MGTTWEIDVRRFCSRKECTRISEIVAIRCRGGSCEAPIAKDALDDVRRVP